MIEYLKVEIKRMCINKDLDNRELNIIVHINNQLPYEYRRTLESNEFITFFNQIFDCAKSEIL